MKLTIFAATGGIGSQILEGREGGSRDYRRRPRSKETGGKTERHACRHRGFVGSRSSSDRVSG